MRLPPSCGKRPQDRAFPTASPAATSRAIAPSSGAAPTVRRGCWSSGRRPNPFRTRIASGARRPASRRVHRACRSRRAAARSTHLLSRAVRRSRRAAQSQRASQRQLSLRTGDRSRRHAGMVGRHRRAGLGYQPGIRRHADVRNDPPRRTRRVHSLRRHDLRGLAGSRPRFRSRTERCGRT